MKRRRECRGPIVERLDLLGGIEDQYVRRAHGVETVCRLDRRRLVKETRVADRSEQLPRRLRPPFTTYTGIPAAFACAIGVLIDERS